MSLRDQLGGARRTGGPKTSFGPAIVAGMVLTLIVAAAGALWLKSSSLQAKTDAQTLCPTEAPVAGITVVLLDISDQFTERQRLDVTNRLQRLRKSLPRFGLVEVYTVDRQNRSIPVPLIHLCSPGRGSEMNRLYQNPQLAQKRWEGFSQRLDTEIGRLLAVPPAETSPILEAIQATALRTFGTPAYDGVEKRLIVVSDLLQNVPGKLNQYHAVPDFESFRRTPYFSEIRADLQDVAVDLYYLRRTSGTPQGMGHIEFWRQLLSAEGAQVDSVEAIYGDQ